MQLPYDLSYGHNYVGKCMITMFKDCEDCYRESSLNYMNKGKNLSPSQGFNLGLPNTNQMLLPLSHQNS